MSQIAWISWKGGNERENLNQTLDQFTGMHFLDLNPNSYDINTMKLDLNVPTKVKFKWSGPLV